VRDVRGITHPVGGNILEDSLTFRKKTRSSAGSVCAGFASPPETGLRHSRKAHCCQACSGNTRSLAQKSHSLRSNVGDAAKEIPFGLCVGSRIGSPSDYKRSPAEVVLNAAWVWSKRTSRLDFPVMQPNFPARLAKWYDDSGGARSRCRF